MSPSDAAGVSTATEMSELEAASGTALPPARALPSMNERTVKSAQFAGSWVYAKTSGSAVSSGGKAQYPPEFIEVTMTEVDGALHGQYRSRYQVLDHAISPDVNFDFSGKPVGSSLSCPWRGPGGARGRLTVRLLPGEHRGDSVECDGTRQPAVADEWNRYAGAEVATTG